MKERRGFSMRWFIQMIIQIAVFAIMLVGFFMKLQEDITTANAKADMAEIEVATHVDKTDVHMPMAEKIEMFVPRREVQATLNSINQNLTEIKSEIIAMRKDMYSK